MAQKKLEKMVALATQDKRVIAGEVAAALLFVYRKKLIQDPGMNRNMLNFHGKIDTVRARGTNWWLDLHSATISSLSDKLEEARGTDEYERLLALKRTLEEKAGRVADGARFVVRSFDLGNTGSGPNQEPLEVSGEVRSVFLDDDGTVISVEEIDPIYGTNESLDSTTAPRLHELTDPLD